MAQRPVIGSELSDAFAARSKMLTAKLKRIMAEVVEGIPVWEKKTHAERPVLSEAGRGLISFRKWNSPFDSTSNARVGAIR